MPPQPPYGPPPGPPYGPQQPPYGWYPPPYGWYPPPQPPPQSGLAVASMVIGILSWVFVCFYGFPGILAVILGHMARSQIRAGTHRGEGMAIAGLILGYIAAAGAAMFLLYVVIASTLA
ncbi:DUF4190 domain-containing protein [Nonomuraea zeae]|uniref:DUF4190 domain-containing protein n=1 Tax=Nonomuraea zeae TaxID=1642303 RepID=UPI00361FE929